jgi:hypothetical protein
MYIYNDHATHHFFLLFFRSAVSATYRALHRHGRARHSVCPAAHSFRSVSGGGGEGDSGIAGGIVLAIVTYVCYDSDTNVVIVAVVVIFVNTRGDDSNDDAGCDCVDSTTGGSGSCGGSGGVGDTTGGGVGGVGGGGDGGGGVGDGGCGGCGGGGGDGIAWSRV